MIRHDNIAQHRMAILFQDIEKGEYVFVYVSDSNEGQPLVTGEGDKIYTSRIDGFMLCHTEMKVSCTNLFSMGILL